MRKEGAILDQAGSRRKPPTFDRYSLRSLVPAVGWQGVYYAAELGQHQLAPVHALALGHRRTYDAHTGCVQRAAWVGPEDEAWEIFALEYHVVDGWIVCDDLQNWCALLAPGMGLAAFEVLSPCGARTIRPHRQQERARMPTSGRTEVLWTACKRAHMAKDTHGKGHRARA